MSNISFQVIVALFDTWHQHKRNFYIETTLKNNMYCKYSHCSMKQTFMKICLIENCQNIKVHDQKTTLFNLAKICFYWLAVDVSGGHFNNLEMQSMQWVLEQHPLTFILPRKSNSKLPLFGEHRPFRRWLILILFRCIIFEVCNLTQV